MRKRGLYAQTVTVYHADAAAQSVTHTVLRGVYFQYGRRTLPAADGTRAAAVLLLVIPAAAGRWGADYTLAPGDRLLLGAGKAVAWADWPRFVPAEHDDVAIVQQVTPLRLRGELHHVEATVWWNTTGTGARSLVN